VGVIALSLTGFLIFRANMEARAHTDCSNNLKQIGLGLVNYSASYDSLFPYGTIQNDKLHPERRLSWLVTLSSFLDQWYWILDQSRAWDDDANRITRGHGVEGEPVIVWQIPLLTCPAVTEPKDAHLPEYTSYVGIAGIGRDVALLPKSHPRRVSLDTTGRHG
jgi:hypothetical protein